MREEFEIRFPVPFGVEWRDGSYHISKPNRQQVTLLSHLFYIGRWETWQASRAALVIELPSARNSSCAFFTDECFDADELVKSLESLGIQVKP